MANTDKFQKTLTHHAIEEDLKKLLDENTFKSLSIPSFSIPYIDQKLPRKSGDIFPLVEGFDNLKLLQKKSMDKALYSVYSKVKSSTKCVCLFTYVMEGLGDYAIQKRLYRLFSKRLENQKILLITLIQEKFKTYVKPLSKDHYFLFYQGVKPPKPQMFSKKLLSQIERSDLLCMVPTYYPYLDDLLKNYADFKGSLEGIGEYGFYHSKAFHPKSPFTSFGAHFLELGLLFEEQKSYTNNSLLNFSNKTTLQYLLKSKLLNEKSIQDYFHSHKLHFSYFQTDKCFELYLKLLLKLYKNSEKTFDIVTTDLMGYLKVLERISSEFTSLNIKSFEIFFDGKLCTQHISDKGITFRLIHLGRLTEEEFSLFLSISESPIGVRGNTSITDAIFYNKGFIYDCPKHCTNFLYSLIDIASSRLKCYPFLEKLLSSFLPGFDLETSLNTQLEALSHPDYKIAMQEFRQILLNQHDARENITNLISRSLFHLNHPKAKNFEQDQMQNYLTQEIDLKELFKRLRKNIDM